MTAAVLHVSSWGDLRLLPILVVFPLPEPREGNNNDPFPNIVDVVLVSSIAVFSNVVLITSIAEEAEDRDEVEHVDNEADNADPVDIVDIVDVVEVVELADTDRPV